MWNEYTQTHTAHILSLAFYSELSAFDEKKTNGIKSKRTKNSILEADFQWIIDFIYCRWLFGDKIWSAMHPKQMMYRMVRVL